MRHGLYFGTVIDTRSLTGTTRGNDADLLFRTTPTCNRGLFGTGNIQ